MFSPRGTKKVNLLWIVSTGKFSIANGNGFLLPPLAGQVVLIFPAYRQAGVLLQPGTVGSFKIDKYYFVIG